MADIMIDFETLSTGSFPAAISFAAIEFERMGTDTKTSLMSGGKVFFCFIDYEECIKHGAGVGANTLQWWMEQTIEAKAFAFTKNEVERLSPARFIDRFNAYLGRGDHTLWCRGQEFDISILKRMYEIWGYKFPVKYDAVRDVRTVLDLAFGPQKVMLASVDTETWNSHNPMEDCTKQILQVQAAYAKVRHGRL